MEVGDGAARTALMPGMQRAAGKKTFLGDSIVRMFWLLACFVLGLVLPVSPAAAVGGDSGKGVRFDQQQLRRWRVGMIVQAVGGPCRGLFATIPVPTDWPEQSVKIVDEDFSPAVRRVSYRTLDDGVKQMLVFVPALNAGESAKALVTFEVRRSSILPPEDPGVFAVPQRMPREIRKFLGNSPYIESRHAQIRSLAKKITKDKTSAWEQVESIYDYVRDNVEYREGRLKGALAALRDGQGDCEEMTSLFVALCRASDIPARMVWVPDHCYPEFYLEDDQQQGHWIPCQAAGTRSFGGMPEFRPILQKGDNFRVPEKREPQRYVAEFLKGNAIRGGGNPTVQFVREVLPGE